MTKKLTKPALAMLCASPVFIWRCKNASAHQAPLSDQKKAGVNYASFYLLTKKTAVRNTPVSNCNYWMA